MSYEPSQVFKPDTNRGYWAKSNDFVYAGLGLAFRLDVFSKPWLFKMKSTMTGLLPVYALSIFLYIVPVMMLQTFLGQFSNSGYISAFRLSPVFKAIGYISLVLNICVVTFYSVFAVVPLVYMFGSMQSSIPWSCESFENWGTNFTKVKEINYCKLYIEDEPYNETRFRITTHHIPSVLYFKTLLNDMDLFENNSSEFSISWQLLMGAGIVWSIIILFTCKVFYNIERFGQIIRYIVGTLCLLLVLLVMCFSCFPAAEYVYQDIASPVWNDILNAFINMPIYSLSAFGPGWGLFITLSSFNKFKNNTLKQSFTIGLGQMIVLIGFDLLANLTEIYIQGITDDRYFLEVDKIWNTYLTTATVIVYIDWANMWSTLFYFMLFLSNMLLILLQLHGILITIFDEFVSLRKRKIIISLALAITLGITSIYFTSNHGIAYIVPLLTNTYITQMMLNLLLIFIILWIYGRVNFQSDMQFMQSTRIATWIIFIIKYLAPLGMLAALVVALKSIHYDSSFANATTEILTLIFTIIPWLFIPVYAVLIMRKYSGSFKIRLQYLFEAKDWHPVEEINHQLYDDRRENRVVSYELKEIDDNSAEE